MTLLECCLLSQVCYWQPIMSVTTMMNIAPTFRSFPPSSSLPFAAPQIHLGGSVGALYAPPAEFGADPSEKGIFVFSKRPLLSDDS